MLKRKKGQQLIVEEMILFGIGLIIALGFLSAFQGFEKGAKEQSGKDQIEQMGEIISAQIMELVQTKSEGKLIFELPQTLGGERYYIKLKQGGILIQTQSNKVYVTHVFGLDKKYYFKGGIESSSKKATLTLENKTITLGI